MLPTGVVRMFGFMLGGPCPVTLLMLLLNRSLRSGLPKADAVADDVPESGIPVPTDADEDDAAVADDAEEGPRERIPTFSWMCAPSMGSLAEESKLRRREE